MNDRIVVAVALAPHTLFLQRIIVPIHKNGLRRGISGEVAHNPLKISGDPAQRPTSVPDCVQLRAGLPK